MTDRHNGYIVTLDHDIREDDAEAVIIAINMIKDVTSVIPVVDNVEVAMATERVKHELLMKIYKMIREV